MTINRTVSPEIQDIKDFKITRGETFVSKSGIPIHFINDTNSDVLKIDFVFDAGNRVQTQAYQANATNSMLTEGTTKHTSKQIAEKLDYFGAYLQNRTGLDDAALTLYCLPKHLASCLPFISDILSNANFPEQELSVLKTNAVQRFKVNQNKNSFLARRAFYKSVFGNKNTYGSPVNQEDIENISRETLLPLYEESYRNKVKYVLIAGNASNAVLAEIDAVLNGFSLVSNSSKKVEIQETPVEKLFIQKENSVQAAIRIGRKFTTRKDPDFRKFQVLNLALGGYFGSRLMANIREEKGLTYGIYSAVESFFDSGSFFIDTEMNNELVETGIKEIYAELAKLRNEPIGNEEFKTAKNYMLGSFLRSLDGPFSLADRYKILIDFNLNYDYYSEYVEIIKSISALEIQELANKYLQEKDLTEVVVGKK